MNLMELSKAKRKVLHSGWGSPKAGRRTDREQEEKRSGVLVDKRLDTSWHRVLVAQHPATGPLGCIRNSGVREGIVPLCSPP